MPEVARLGMLVDAPGPCHHKNVNPIVIERIPEVMHIPDRVHVRCPVEDCDNHWYVRDLDAPHRD